MTLVVAFDFSLNPGVAIVSRDASGWTRTELIGWWVKPAKEMQLEYSEKQETLSVHLLQALPPSSPDLERYAQLLEPLFSRFLAPRLKASSTVEVVLEGYAFLEGHAAHTYKLHEITGILKWELRKHGFPAPRIVSCAAWRKRVLGSARADKRAALVQFNVEFPGVDLLLFANKQPLGKTVPSPVQDLVEAWCIARAAALGLEPVKYRHSKRKTTVEVKRKPSRRRRVATGELTVVGNGLGIGMEGWSQVGQVEPVLDTLLKV